jgi:hypothetical protein
LNGIGRGGRGRGEEKAREGESRGDEEGGGRWRIGKERQRRKRPE